MGGDVGQIFPTASLHRDHSILYALVCEKELSHMGKNNENPDLVCEKTLYPSPLHLETTTLGPTQEMFMLIAYAQKTFKRPY